VSEDQTDNVYSALLPMIELGALRGEIEDTGLGRINLAGRRQDRAGHGIGACRGLVSV
jgi:hypothetical protein